MALLIIGLVLFLGIHSTRMVGDIRANTIAQRGEATWKAVYSLASIIGFVVLIYGYGQARQSAPVLYVPPTSLQPLNWVLMWPAMILLVASQVPAGKIKAAVKHPMVLGIKIWALAHLLVNGELASVILFVSFLGWAVWNRVWWKRHGDPTTTTVAVRNDIIAIVGGTVAYIVFVVWLHEWLIGVSPVA